MSHFVSGLIARSELLGRLAGSLATELRLPLAQGFAFVPLDGDNLDAIPTPAGPRVPRFSYLSEGLVQVLCAASQACELAYVETNYFGGAGWQGALACAGGEAVYGPVTAQFGPINDALALLGVRRAAGRSLDEFDCVGLGGFSDNDEARAAVRAALDRSLPPG